MFLEKLKITGYKNFRDEFIVNFSKGLNVLVGENGVGKTAIIDAIRLMLLEDEFGRRGISESDFHRPFEEDAAAAESFRIQAHFGDLSREEMVAFLPWMDPKGNAKLTLDVDNKPKKQGRFRPFRWGGASRASAFEWELFDRINCIYLPPLRDAEAKLREGRGSRLARLLRNLNKNEEAQNAIETRVKQFNDELAREKTGAISQANELIRERLNEALGRVFAQDTSIRFSETNFNRIVESLRLLFFPRIESVPKQELFRNLEENSLGYNNLIYIATVLAELTTPSEEAEYLRVLLIEEPEAHLHPQLQVRLLKYLEETATESGVQVIVTTHSPVLASSVSLKSIIHLSSSEHIGPCAVSIRSCGLPNKSEAFLSRWLDVTKSTLLFAKGIILVEGIAEAMLLPELAKSVLKKYNEKLNKDNDKKLPETLEDCGVSVINMNGIYFKHFMQLFCNLDSTNGNNLSIRCAGIIDQDPPKDSKPTPSNKVQGDNPALKLMDKTNKSKWARLYANELKTFEYDLAFEGDNIKVMANVLTNNWPTDGDVKEKIQKLADKDWKKVSECEKAEAASLLLSKIEDSNNMGKGQFAQLLAEEIKQSAELTIPKCIYNAVIWACGGNPDD